MSDVYLGEDHYKNIAITEINEAINFCMTNNLSKEAITLSFIQSFIFFLLYNTPNIMG